LTFKPPSLCRDRLVSVGSPGPLPTAAPGRQGWLWPAFLLHPLICRHAEQRVDGGAAPQVEMRGLAVPEGPTRAFSSVVGGLPVGRAQEGPKVAKAENSAKWLGDFIG
jgi:hypothetical protein